MNFLTNIFGRILGIKKILDVVKLAKDVENDITVIEQQYPVIIQASQKLLQDFNHPDAASQDIQVLLNAVNEVLTNLKATLQDFKNTLGI